MVKEKERLYYARILPRVGIYDVLDMKVRSVYDSYFVCVEKRDKHSYLFNNKELEKTVFKNREDALRLVLEAEKNKPKVSSEVYYEED